jgi:hypothetical protein
MTEREAVDAFARQVAEVIRRLEEDRNKPNTEEESSALRRVRAGES